MFDVAWWHFHLVVFDEPLFPETIEAWTHGPVVDNVYHEYKGYGSQPIPPEDVDFSLFDEGTKEFLNDIYCEFGQYSAWKLREITHNEPPWRDAYTADNPGLEISHKSLIDYFSQFVEEVDDDDAALDDVVVEPERLAVLRDHGNVRQIVAAPASRLGDGHVQAADGDHEGHHRRSYGPLQARKLQACLRSRLQHRCPDPVARPATVPPRPCR